MAAAWGPDLGAGGGARGGPGSHARCPSNDDALELEGRVLYRVVAGARVEHGVAFALDGEGDEPRRISDHLLRYPSDAIRRAQA